MTNKETQLTDSSAGPDSADAGRKTLQIKGVIFKDAHERNAVVATSPAIRGATTGMQYAERVFSEKLDLTAYSRELRKQAEIVQAGNLAGMETMLVAQANTLDMIFNQMARKAANCEYIANMEAHLRLALKAQAQCAQTIRVLGELKNPKSIAFIKQQNNAAGHQQVNNGQAQSVRAHGENAVTSNELLEHNNGERLDTGTTSQAGGSNQAMAAVGEVDGAAD
ncbi:hypothetical protein [Burkholderia cepacia]|uniref:hypothetical protein n=1 Tax=Burkholderia cepacia TaxID=292 RepID=UPI001E3D2BE7|nr:hypothetical protein [Burkholderia cepacia]